MKKLNFKNKNEFAQAILQYGKLWNKDGNKVYCDFDKKLRFYIQYEYHIEEIKGAWNYYENDWYIEKPYFNIPDKTPVWIWDDDETTQLTLRFWDAKNQNVYSDDGRRASSRWDNVRPLTLEEKDILRPLIDEMKKHLKD